jgi:hypothetical protein
MHILLPLTVFLLAGSLFAADSSPFIGTWKLNLAKSKFEGPMKPPKELIIVIQEQGDQSFDTVKRVAADGTRSSDKYTFPRTGGDVKVLEGGSAAGTSGVLATRKADAPTRDWKIMRNGKVIVTEHDVVSEDGKTISMTFQGTDAQGKAYETVEVFDRM